MRRSRNSRRCSRQRTPTHRATATRSPPPTCAPAIASKARNWRSKPKRSRNSMDSRLSSPPSTATSRQSRIIKAIAAAIAMIVLLWLYPTQANEPTGPLFREAAAETGLSFVHDNGGRGQFYLPEIMGSGVALFDYDGDGDLDVYLVQGARRKGNRLFRNDLTIDANGRRTLRFVDVTEQAHVGLDAISISIAISDYDNDSRLNIYVTN